MAIVSNLPRLHISEQAEICINNRGRLDHINKISLIVATILDTMQSIELFQVPDNDPDILVLNVNTDDKSGMLDIEDTIVEQIIKEIPEEEFLDFMIKVTYNE